MKYFKTPPFLLIILTLFGITAFGQNNAQFISQTVPTSVNAGASFNVSIVLKNTGTTTWTNANAYRLGSQNPQDNTTWGTTRIVLPNSVVPNAQVTITASLTAPLNQNPANFQWKMVQDGVEWFGEQTQLVPITIPGAVVDDAQFISQVVPATVQAGSTFNVQLTFKNNGTTTWSENDQIRLGSKSPDNNMTWGTNRMYLASPVAPTEDVTFNVNLTAPTTTGFYDFQWQMERELFGWFGEIPALTQIAVTNTTSDSLLTSGDNFTTNSHIVSTSFFCWYGQGEWQVKSPWIPEEGRNAWDGSINYWKSMIKQTMYANIDVLYIELIPLVEQSRGNLFIALKELRAEGWDVPKICPFLDPQITYSVLGYSANCATSAGKDELISHYIRFYQQYYLVNTDQYADDYVYTQDNRPVLNTWHIQLDVQNYNLLTRNDVTSRLSAALGATHPIFNNDIKMINNAISPAYTFADERVHQFEVHQYNAKKYIMELFLCKLNQVIGIKM